MSMSWETTEDDIAAVLERHLGGPPSRKLLQTAIEACEGFEDRIEDAALKSAASVDFENDLDDQVDGAYAEILAILIEEGVVRPSLVTT